MADKFRLTVLTPQRTVFDDDVASVQASGHVGDFGVLPGHYPYITSVRPGGLAFDAGGTRHTFAVGHGFAQVSAEKVSIVVSSCESVSDLDRAEQTAALTKAEDALMSTGPGDSAYADAKVDQEMALGRLLALDLLGGQ